MPRHVVQSLRRPCVLAQWHPPSIQRPRRRYSEIETSQPDPPTLNREQSLHLLRVADQKFLRDCKATLSDLITSIKKSKEDILSIPVTVQNSPTTGIPPYQLGQARQLYRTTLPAAADRAIETAEHVKEHLIDLQYAPYKDKSENPLVEFEKSIEDWTAEEKKSEAKKLEYEGEAMLARLNDNSRVLYERLQEMISESRKSAVTLEEKTAMDTSIGRGGRLRRVAGRGERRAEKENSAPAPAPPPEQDLHDLQKQLQESMNKPKQKKKSDES